MEKISFCFRVEPELKQLQIKYEELQERKASLRKAAYFLSNLKQLHQDYSDVQEEEPSVKETVSSVFNFHSASENTGQSVREPELQGENNGDVRSTQKASL